MHNSEHFLKKKNPGVWEDVLLVKVVVPQARGPKFDSQHPSKSWAWYYHTYNPAGEKQLDPWSSLADQSSHW